MESSCLQQWAYVCRCVYLLRVPFRERDVKVRCIECLTPLLLQIEELKHFLFDVNLVDTTARRAAGKWRSEVGRAEAEVL